MNRKARIETLLKQHLSPFTLIIEDESPKHHVPADGESHFNITIVSSLFEPLPRIQRHRLVNSLLADELKQGLHALSLHLYTATEWAAREEKTQASPACRDGFRHGRNEK